MLFIGVALGSNDPLVDWKQIPAWINSVTVNDKEIYVTNRFWQLFRCERPCHKGQWQNKGWYAASVASNKWEVWVVAVNGRIFRSRTPADQCFFFWPNRGWSIMDGIVSQLSLGTNMVAAIGLQNDAYITSWDFASNTQSQPSWELLSGRWKKLSVSADNQLWGISDSGQVFRYSKNRKIWKLIPNPTNIDFNSISVGRLYVYATAKNTQIYRCVRPCKFGGWQLTFGNLQDVSGEHTANDIVYGLQNGGSLYEGKIVPIQN